MEAQYRIETGMNPSPPTDSPGLIEALTSLDVGVARVDFDVCAGLYVRDADAEGKQRRTPGENFISTDFDFRSSFDLTPQRDLP